MFESIVEAILYYSEKQPDHFCIADDHNSFTYLEYKNRILQYASYFSDLGFVRDTKIVIEANQSVDYLAMQAAIQLIGSVFVPVEHNCAAEKVATFIGRSGAAAAIVNKVQCEPGCTMLTYETVQNAVESAPLYTVSALPRKDDIAEILFSTGTTGKEKGIVLTHRNNIALAQNVMNGVRMEKDNVEMIPSPMNHSHGLRRYYANMYNGSSVVLLGSVMDMARFFGNIDQYHVNSMDLVPSALAVVLRLSKRKLADYADRLRYLQFGSAPLADADVQLVCELLPNTRMYNIYGSTESGCTCIYDFNCKEQKKNCIGKPTCNTTVLFVDDDRHEIEASPDHTGLIATVGDMNMSEYWQDAEETARAMENGIIYSNDIGYFDADGDIILIGRKGDVINIGGMKVAPDEIENAAKKMPEIFDCGCIAVPDPAKGQVPKLFVQMASGVDFDAKAIRSFLMEHLEPYKVPAYIEQIKKIPRTFNGKLLRKELK